MPRYPNFAGDISIRQRPPSREPKETQLSTIVEGPSASHQSPEIATGTTGIGESLGEEDGETKKVSKGQMNALARMLSALRR